MDLISKSNQKRERYLQGVEDYFNWLPQQLYRQGVLLRNKLAIQYSETGRFVEILSRVEHYPVLEMVFWFLDDYNFPEGEGRSILEKHLFLGNFFTFTSIYTKNLFLDEDLFFNGEYLLLVNLLMQEADRHFSHVFPADSTFWLHHQDIWRAYSEARLIVLENYSTNNSVVTPEQKLQRADLLAPYQLIPMGVAILAGRDNEVDKLSTIMGNLHKLQIVLHDLENLPVDLQKGIFTYPILHTYAELGIPLIKEYSPESMLMAMKLSGAFSKITEDCQAWISSCISGAEELKLDNLHAYFSALEGSMQERISRFSPEKTFDDERGDEKLELDSSVPISVFEPDNLSKSIDIAEGYLLSDLTFQESWEVHRWGMDAEAIVISRFPAGLITEVISSHGYNLTEQVEAFFRHSRENNFSYYDHKKLPYADSDTLGVLLKLYGYSSNQNANQEILEIPLSWMKSSVEKSGHIPVWIRGTQDIERDESRPVRLLGEGCGSIEAKLLIGLCDYDWESFRDIVQSSAMQLLKRFIDQGAGITVNYPKLYCLWRIKQLLISLYSHSINVGLIEIVNQANELYPHYLEQEINQYRITPQQAAFLILACLDSPAKRMLDRKWVSILIRNQRSDGSWYGEPIFFVPNKGAYTTWHSSHQLTTAFCYDALQKYRTSAERI